MIKFVPQNKGPAVIKAMNSNTLSDSYRDSITIAYQYIGSTTADITFTLNGKTYDTPIMAGPIGLGDKGTGMQGYARAVTAAGSLYWAHFHDPAAWDEVLRAGNNAIRVIKPLMDLKRFKEEVKQDEDRGAHGYATDIDHGITPYGEIDIIAQMGQMLCFVEVKTRNSSAFGAPRLAVDKRKQQHLISAAQVFLQLAESNYEALRFDVIECTPDGVNRLEDAFRLE